VRFLCSLWQGTGFWKSVARYSVEDVAYLANALERFGHRLTCITDDPSEVEKYRVEAIPMPADVAALPDYQPKLWIWSPELHALIGEPFAHIDLDCVVLDDPATVFHPKHKLQFWNWARQEPYNTSLVYITPGHGCEVWANRNRIDEAKALWPYWTGDQSLVGWTLGPNEWTFGPDDGIVNFSRIAMHDLRPPAAKVVFFCGPLKPRDWAEQVKWIGDAMSRTMDDLDEQDDRKRLKHLQKDTQQHRVLIKFVQRYDFMRGAEIGVLRGKTLFTLLDACPDLHMFGVDQWLHNPDREDENAENYRHFDMGLLRGQVMQKAADYGPRCTILPGDSVEMAQHVEDGTLDFIFLDGDHTEAGLERDLRAWVPKVRKGGLITGHDYNWPTVSRVLDRLAPGWAGVNENVWCIPRRMVKL